MVTRSWLVCAVLVAGVTAPAPAQESLTLAEALARADRSSYANRMAVGTRQAQEGEGLAAWRGILPGLRVEAGWMRTTDPLSAFGFVLRQRAMTPEAFDPARLNAPPATSGVGSALVLEQPLLNLDAWLGRKAAAMANGAAQAAERWTATVVRVDVVRAWFGGVLASDKVGTLEAAFQAATSHVRQATALLDQGMVTRADLLLAQVKAGELEADLLAAKGDQQLAVSRLAMVLGTPEDSALRLPARLPDAPVVATALAGLQDAGGNPLERADVEAARYGDAAARGDLRRTRASLLPRINGVARYDWNDREAVFGGRPGWTLGIMASWSPFTGAAELSAVRAAQGRVAIAEAGAEVAAAQAQLESAERQNALAVALARLAITERSVEQSTEAHRLVGRSYAGGLVTITELLAAAAAETGARLARAATLYAALVAAAERQQAFGLSLDPLTALGR